MRPRFSPDHPASAPAENQASERPMMAATPAWPTASGPSGPSATARHFTRPSRSEQIRWTPWRATRQASPAGRGPELVLRLGRGAPLPARMPRAVEGQGAAVGGDDQADGRRGDGVASLPRAGAIPRRPAPRGRGRGAPGRVVPGSSRRRDRARLRGPRSGAGARRARRESRRWSRPRRRRLRAGRRRWSAARTPSGPIARSSTGDFSDRFQIQRPAGVALPRRSRSCTMARPNESGWIARWVISTRLRSTRCAEFRRAS